MRRRRYQYRPDVSVRFSPRVPVRLRGAVNALCKRHEMPEVDVLRYSFEAVVLLVAAGKLRFEQVPRTHLEGMVTVRTSRKIAIMAEQIFERLRAEGVEPKRPHHPQQTKLEHADVLRGLIGMAVSLAREKGMARVMGIREKMLKS